MERYQFANMQFNPARKVLASVLLITMAFVAALNFGCASRMHATTATKAIKADVEPERTMRMLVYSRALNDKTVFPFKDRICYLVESDKFVEELKHKTATEKLKRCSPIIFKRMRAGICEEPGFCFWMRFTEISETKAIGDLYWVYPNKNAVGGGREIRFELEKRDGAWIILKIGLSSWLS